MVQIFYHSTKNDCPKKKHICRIRAPTAAPPRKTKRDRQFFPDSSETESFAAGMLEYPQYTRPRMYKGMEVPEELLSGNHGRIEAWRKNRALERTRQRRPDLITRNIE